MVIAAILGLVYDTSCLVLSVYWPTLLVESNVVHIVTIEGPCCHIMGSIDVSLKFDSSDIVITSIP